MRVRHLRWLALAMCAITTPAAAQDHDSTRTAAVVAARQAKAAATEPFRPGRVERLLTFVETSPVVRRIFVPTDGVGVRIGGIAGGAGFAAGPMWRGHDPLRGTVQLRASAAAAIGGDSQIEAAATLPQIGSHRLSASVQAASTRLGRERFFGPGGGTLRGDQTAFRLDERQVTTSLVFDATGWLRVSGGASILRTTAADAVAPGIPGISTRFSSRDAPGHLQDAAFRVLSVDATVDYRDMPGNPRSGGRYTLGVQRYVDTAADHYTFTRIDLDLEQHLSAWKGQRVLTLRAVTSASIAGDGREVPFHLQRTLGGSRLLRGFVTDRFRDTNLLALQAESGSWRHSHPRRSLQLSTRRSSATRASSTTLPAP